MCPYGAGGLAQDAFGGAAGEQELQAGQAHGAHHDQVAVLFAVLRDNLVLDRPGEIRRRMLNRTVVSRAV